MLTILAAASIVSPTPRPNVGKHPFTGWRRQQDHRHLPCVTKQLAVTLEHDGGNMYAIFVEAEVNADVPRDDQVGQRLQETVVPMARDGGARAGYWLRSQGGRGVAVVVYDSEEAARHQADQLKVGEAAPGAPPGITLRTVEVREVLASL